VTQVSSTDPWIEFDWCIWVGFRPGVRDNPGSTATEAIEDVLGIRLSTHEAVYTSKRYCLTGRNLTESDVKIVANELLANDIIQQVRIYAKNHWNPKEGSATIPKVKLDHVPTVTGSPWKATYS
jgi:phosphoribosylformylglycinamidine synthase